MKTTNERVIEYLLDIIDGQSKQLQSLLRDVERENEKKEGFTHTFDPDLLVPQPGAYQTDDFKPMTHPYVKSLTLGSEYLDYGFIKIEALHNEGSHMLIHDLCLVYHLRGNSRPDNEVASFKYKFKDNQLEIFPKKI